MGPLCLKTWLLLPLLIVLAACDIVGAEDAAGEPIQPAGPTTVHDVTGYYFNSAEVLTYLHPVRMFEERGVYERSDGSLEVMHADTHNLVIKLHPLVLPDDRDDIKQELVDQALLYGVLKVFTHTEVEWLDLSVTPLLARAVVPNAENGVVYLSQPARQVALSRAQAQAFLRAHSSARSFSDLVDTHKNWHHLRGAESLLYADLYYGPGRASQLATLLSQQYAKK